MNILSLFDGMSCGQIAFDKLGIKFDGEENKYFASEIKKIGIKVTKHNYPNTIHIGDVTKVHYKDGVLYTENGEYKTKIDMIIGGSPCFVAGTLVLTDKGFKNIEDIVAGDYVLTHTNTFQKVIVPMRKIADHIYRLKTMCSEDLLVTEEHPFYVRKKYREWDKSIKKNLRKFEEPTWVAAKDLSKDHYVGIAINQESKLPQWEGIEKVVNQHTTKKEDNIVTLFNKENFWWTIGRYLGDGWTTLHKRKDRENSFSYKTIICCSKKNNELSNIEEKLTGLFKYSIIEERTTFKISIYNEELFKYLEQFGKYAANKKLTSDIFNLPKNLLDSFLQGYFSADGCITQQGEIRCSSVSKELIYGIGQCVAKAYNRPFSIGKYHYNDTHIIEGREVNQKPNYVLNFKKETSKQDKAFFENGYIWCPIHNLVKEEYNDVVYNMEVENDNSYTVNNIIVHNCQNFSTARACKYEIDGLEGDKSRLFYEYLRLLKEINPKYFLLENVKMKDKHYNELNDYLGVKGIYINSRLVSYQNRPRYYWTNIPNVTIPEDRHISFQDYKETDPEICRQYKLNPTPSRIKMWNNGEGKNALGTCANVTNSDIVYCLTRKQDRSPNSGLVACEDFARFLTRRELEQAQTVPVGYTDILSYGQMQDLCGDGWTVDVISHILGHIDFKEFGIERK